MKNDELYFYFVPWERYPMQVAEVSKPLHGDNTILW